MSMNLAGWSTQIFISICNYFICLRILDKLYDPVGNDFINDVFETICSLGSEIRNPNSVFLYQRYFETL